MTTAQTAATAVAVRHAAAMLRDGRVLHDGRRLGNLIGDLTDELDRAARLYAQWVPDGAPGGWALDDCHCEPEREHCPRCDGRRLMLAVQRLVTQ